jgi:signal transduction histidine kinase
MPLDRSYLRVTLVARLFVLLALAFPVVWSRNGPTLFALVGVGIVWVLVTVADHRPGYAGMPLTVMEGLAVGAIGAASLTSGEAVLGALVIPPFVAGVYRGLWGVAQALCAQVAGLMIALAVLGQSLTADQGYSAFSWSFTGLGLGLIGTFLHSALHDHEDPLGPYHYAQTLLRQLISISDGLDSGIDPMSLGGEILSEVRDEVPSAALALYVPRGDTLTPLVTKEIGGADLSRCEEVAVEAWSTGAAVFRRGYFAFPLATDSGTPGIVTAALSDRTDLDAFDIRDALARLGESLRPSAVHLDTALLFAAFRDSATTEERRRLAREMHDGVAQDIASLGYLVDAVQAAEHDPRQAERLSQVRDRITDIVAEVRRSLVNLRTSIGASESLGAAIASVARNLSEASGVPIHVTADELTDRLRPEVEGELFRIAQEAMNNAVKHARAQAIEVTCQVRAPGARIVVVDDGRGLQKARTDSHGLKIMRERAHLVGASLEIGETPGGGLTVSVVIPGDAAGSIPAPAPAKDARVAP